MNNDNTSHVPSESALKHITLGTVLGWGFGVLLLMMGVTSIVKNLLSGTLLILGALLLLPPIQDYLVRKKNIKISKGLRITLVLLLFIISMSVSTSSKVESILDKSKGDSSASTQQVNKQATEQLELLSMNCSKDYGYFEISGEIKNLSGKSLDNVMVVGNIYTADGTFITSSEALIAYNPVLPNQTSPFKTMTTDNPLADKCTVTFKELMGGTISFKNSATSK